MFKNHHLCKYCFWDFPRIFRTDDTFHWCLKFTSCETCSISIRISRSQKVANDINPPFSNRNIIQSQTRFPEFHSGADPSKQIFIHSAIDNDINSTNRNQKNLQWKQRTDHKLSHLFFIVCLNNSPHLILSFSILTDSNIYARNTIHNTSIIQHPQSTL